MSLPTRWWGFLWKGVSSQPRRISWETLCWGLWAGLLRGHREVSCVACPARCTQLGSRRWDHENKLTTVPPSPQNALRSRSGPRRGLTDGSFLLGCFRLTGTEGAQAGARWRQRRARPCVHCEGRRVLVREALPRTRFRMASVVQTGRRRRSKFRCAQRGLVSAAEPPPRPPGRLPRPWPPAFETLPRWAAISTRTPSSHREPGARRPARHLLRGHPVQSARPRVMGTLAPSRRL